MARRLQRCVLCSAVGLFCFLFFWTIQQISPLSEIPSFFGSSGYHSDIQSINWKEIPEHYPVEFLLPLPTATPLQIPRIQHDFSKPELVNDRRKRLVRRNGIRQAFMHSWQGYRKNAWLHDEVKPVSGGYKDHFGGWGATLVDALDTLYIMDLEQDFTIAVADLRKVDFTIPRIESLNVFESTIRYLGGLMSAYDLSKGKYPILLEKAVALGEMLYHAFDTPNRLPVTRWHWERVAYNITQEAASHLLLAEAGSLSLEFTRLSQLTGDSKFYDAVQRVTNALEAQQNDTKLPGLWPIILNGAKGNFKHDRTFTFGGMADSTYEYLPKEYLMLGGLVPQYQDMYERVIKTAKEHLFFRPYTSGNYDILLSGTVKREADEKLYLEPKAQHLTCFVGGMVALGSKIFSRPEDLAIARRLVEGCIWAYNSTATGVMPEIFTAMPCPAWDDCYWDQQEWYDEVNKVHRAMDEAPMPLNERAKVIINHYHLPPGVTSIKDTRYLLRPEAIESLFIMYRITGEKRYQDIAWQMFVNIDRITRTKIGYSAVKDVASETPQKMDSTESFWFAETLKYLYLIFSEPSLVSLDEWVLNTEAHPLRRPLPPAM